MVRGRRGAESADVLRSLSDGGGNIISTGSKVFVFLSPSLHHLTTPKITYTELYRSITKT